MPPPVPWFRGKTVVVSEARTGLVAFRPVAPHAFRSPPDTLELYLPISRIVLVVAEGRALAIHGDFRGSGYPDDVIVAPIDAADAESIEQVLTERLDLPRYPDRIASVADLVTHTGWAFVRVEDEDFSALEIDGAELTDGVRYRVLGYYTSSPPRLAIVEAVPVT